MWFSDDRANNAIYDSSCPSLGLAVQDDDYLLQQAEI